jgi:hypothetical protein
MGGIKTLDGGICNSDHVKIFVAAATTEHMGASVLLLFQRKGVKFFLSNFALQDLLGEF